MDLFANLALGFSVAATLENLGFAFLGCLLGTVIGVLPGLGPLATISMLLPITYGIDPIGALIMLAGIYYGSAYGGSTTAILLNLPGETSAAVTVLDGHAMARQGRAGQALAAAALSSFLAGTVGTLAVALFAIPLTRVAFAFGPAEYFSLMLVGLVGSTALSSQSLVRSSGMVLIGVALGLVGTDVNSGVARYSFGFRELIDGIDFTAVAIGVFAFGETMYSIRGAGGGTLITTRIRHLWLSRQDFRDATPAAARGTMIGGVLGVLPGAGLSIASFMSYALERRLSSEPESFGRGNIRGLAAPEAANNSAAQTAFIPTLALGVPGSATMALMLGAMVLHNIQPGPQVITANPPLFWGLVASMWIGNAMLVVLNLPLVGVWVKLLRIPYIVLYPSVIVFCCIGLYTISNSVFNIMLGAMFGLVGYLLRKINCEPAPMLLGLVLGPMMEESFRRAMVLSHGDWTTFIGHPISAALLAIAVAMIVLPVLLGDRRRSGPPYEE